MKYYQSSYKFGNEIEKLAEMMPQNNKIGVINNSRDYIGVDEDRKKWNEDDEISKLKSLGYQPELLDLRLYFGKKEKLVEKINSLGGIWISGGNVFVLRQAMYLSGLDSIIIEKSKSDEEFLYSGYSAGICVLTKSLRLFDSVDDPKNFPYENIKDTIWEGLGIFNHLFLPHYKSDNSESDSIGKLVTKCINEKRLFITLKDGEVVIC